MNRPVMEVKPLVPCLAVLVAVVGFTAVGCSEFQSGSTVEQGGTVESSTAESDALRRMEERQRGGNGGGGSY